ncbi:MAG TPA: sigma-70 family RNA polymerase sigma factor [Segetibacter sp.]|jgi:RNA polymerase sigma factor (sigma-70 family)
MDDALTISTGMTATRNRNITDIINTYSKRLLGFIRPRVQSEEDAEDILHDVFYQFIGSTKPIEQISAWLFKVARNKITDGQRRMQPALIEDVYDTDDEEAFEWSEVFFNDTDNPETEYLRSMFWEALNNALGELPAEQRDAFILNEMEGIPFKIIAEQTGETINTLLSRKRYAVLHLRKRLSVLRNELLNY